MGIPTLGVPAAALKVEVRCVRVRVVCVRVVRMVWMMRMMRVVSMAWPIVARLRLLRVVSVRARSASVRRIGRDRIVAVLRTGTARCRAASPSTECAHTVYPGWRRRWRRRWWTWRRWRRRRWWWRRRRRRAWHRWRGRSRGWSWRLHHSRRGLVHIVNREDVRGGRRDRTHILVDHRIPGVVVAANGIGRWVVDHLDRLARH